MRIPIFWLADLYQVILGCDETISLMSLSCNSHGVNSTHHCHYTMASANSKFDNLSDTDTDSLIDDAIPKTTKKATDWGISVLKGNVANFKFLIQAILGVSSCCQQVSMQFFMCAVYSIWIIKMLMHSLLVNYWDLPVHVYKQWTRNFQYRIWQSLLRFWNFSLIVSELVWVNSDSSLAKCVNL